MFDKITEAQVAESYVQSAPNRLSGTAQQNKLVFDNLPLLIVDSFNALIDAVSLNGAGNIGAVWDGGALDLQSVLDAVWAALSSRYTKAETDAAIGMETNGSVTGVTFDMRSGVFTIVHKDGSSETIDTALEKVPASFSFVEEEGAYYLRVINIDGSSSSVNVTALMNQYTFVNGATVGFTTETSGTTTVVRAEIRANSIEEGHLSLSLVAMLEGYVSSASASASSAAASASSSAVSAKEADVSAAEAVLKAGEAAASASSASLSASAAGDSSASASASASEASASKEAAAVSAASASASSRSAVSAKEAAESAVSEALSFSAAAETAASGASVSAKAAAGSAVQAESSAGSAGASAESASASANAASVSAASAAGSAEAASSSSASAAGSAAASSLSASDSKSWAVGGTGTRQGEDSNNAKYFAEQAQAIVGGDYVTNTQFKTTLDSYAMLASPSFTGVPAAPTAAADNNSTQVATTAFAHSLVEANREVLYVTYDTDTFATVVNAVDAGKIVMCIRNDRQYIYTDLVSDGTKTSCRFTGVYGTTSAGDSTSEPGIYTMRLDNDDTWHYKFTTVLPTSNAALKGIPTAPTAATDTNSTQIATTAFAHNLVEANQEVMYITYGTGTFAEVEAAVAAGKIVICKKLEAASNITYNCTYAYTITDEGVTSHVFSSIGNQEEHGIPGNFISANAITLDTSNQWDSYFNQLLATYNPALKGVPTAPTARAGTNTTQIATTAFVKTATKAFAETNSPAFIGEPTAPTAPQGTNTTQIATTAFVLENAGNTRTLLFTNVSVPTSAFKSDNVYPDYPYRAEINCSGVTGAYFADVVFNVTEATSGNYAPVTACGPNLVYIYAKEVPSAAITIPTIKCQMAVRQ